MKTDGFIVCNGATGYPEKMVDGILYMGSHGHIFSTSKGARAAIVRTRNFARRKNYTSPQWTVSPYIVRLIKLPIEEETKRRYNKGYGGPKKLLSPEEREHIASVARQGNQRKLARIYGISESLVSKIKVGSR